MYGICLPFEWHIEWEKAENKDFYETYEAFMNDDIFIDNSSNNKKIYCLFDGRDGRFIIIGRILNRSDDDEVLGDNKPIVVPNLNDFEKHYIENLVNKHFGVVGEFHYYFVTKYN